MNATRERRWRHGYAWGRSRVLARRAEGWLVPGQRGHSSAARTLCGSPCCLRIAAIDLEKGARRLYRHVVCRLSYHEIANRESREAGRKTTDASPIGKMVRGWADSLRISLTP